MLPRVVADLPIVTQTFLAVIILMWLYFNISYNEKAANYAPTILTTTGILATFVGIALGLLDLNPKNIEGSLPELLGGLKTAFFASVAGVFCALSIKVRYYLFGVANAEPGESSHGDVTAADLAALLKSIQQALVGNDEATLVSQLKLLRIDSNERLDALKKAQIEALQKLSEMGSASLVSALRDVIRDFNEKLSEQFGENFKQLNDAVGKLLIWQDQYKDHISTFSERQLEIAASMKKSTDDFGNLVVKSNSFTKTAQDLGGLLSALEIQKQNLISMLTELGKLLVTASGSLPQIESKVASLTNQLAESIKNNQTQLSRSLLESSGVMQSTVREVATGLRTAIADQQREVGQALAGNVSLIRDSIRSANDDMSKFNHDLNKQLSELSSKTSNQVIALTTQLVESVNSNQKQVSKSLLETSAVMEATVQQVGRGLSDTVADPQKEVNRVLTDNAGLMRTSIQSVKDDLTKVNLEFNKQLSDLAARTKDQVLVLDNALTEELQKSLESLGRQLAALSERFANDYTPLAEKLRLMLRSLAVTP